MENTIYEEVVRNSLQYVACIDDDFVNPYEVQESNDQLKFTKDMYTTIKEACGSHVEMLRYEKEMDPHFIAKCISNKDLLILDWQLVGENFMPTLEILVRAERMQIPFVCIYTNQPDMEIICQIIKGYFSGHTISEIDEICNCWAEAGIFESDFREDVLELFSAPKSDSRKIAKHVEELYGNSTKEMQKLQELGYKKAKSWYPLWLKWSNVVLPEELLPCASEPLNGTMIINGMLVCCLPKMTSESKNPVDIKDLISSVAKHIVSVPNSIFNILWLNYSNALRDVLQSRTQLFLDLDDRALGYFSKDLLKEGEDIFDDWMKSLFRDEIMDRLDGSIVKFSPDVFDEIKKKYVSVDPNSLVDELVAINEKITVNHMYSRSVHKIDFGDVFVTSNGVGHEETYWMCVTAKCECSRPEDKIENSYLFIKGKEMEKAYTSLKDAESKYRSYIKRDAKIAFVEWNTKLKSVYFESGNNTVNGIGRTNEGVYNGNKLTFTYLCNIKENYAQRMANASFAEGNKVGITLAQIKKEEEPKDNGKKVEESQ